MKKSNIRMAVSFKVMDRRNTSNINKLAKMLISPSSVYGNLIHQMGLLASFNLETKGKAMKVININYGDRRKIKCQHSS